MSPFYGWNVGGVGLSISNGSTNVCRNTPYKRKSYMFLQLSEVYELFSNISGDVYAYHHVCLHVSVGVFWVRIMNNFK